MAPGTWTIEEEEEALFSSALRPQKSSSGPPNSRIRIFIIISDRARLLLHFPFAQKQKLEWEGGGREAGAVEMSISLKDGDVPIPFFYFSLQSSFFRRRRIRCISSAYGGGVFGFWASFPLCPLAPSKVGVE